MPGKLPERVRSSYVAEKIGLANRTTPGSLERRNPRNPQKSADYLERTGRFLRTGDGARPARESAHPSHSIGATT